MLFLPAGAVRAQEAALSWDYPRFRTEEAVATVAFGIGTLVGEVVQPGAERPYWRSGVLFDEPIRRRLRARSQSEQQRALVLSDHFWRASMAYPLVVDIWVLALGVHRSPEVAAQMLLIDLQSYALTGTLSLVGQLLTRRARPYVQACGEGGEVGFSSCGSKRDFTAFPSGHTASAMTAAMLTCSHHRRLDLLGSQAASGVVCAASVAAAVATGVFRIVGDRHYATDVVAGLGIGVLSGYVLPAWLHYGFSLQAPSRPGRPRVRWSVAPRPMGEGGVGLGLVGVLP
ncbi:MAG TPA: phosphatase PAP2 family protein [Aggregicoccus sp.]|nr:phosphatase PAP2 family protein [Aggregicoccus sp.]